MMSPKSFSLEKKVGESIFRARHPSTELVAHQRLFLHDKLRGLR